MKAEQIENAFALGKKAFLENKLRYTWQDHDFIDIMKKHQEIVPGSAKFNELQEAWLIGWDLENLKINNNFVK